MKRLSVLILVISVLVFNSCGGGGYYGIQERSKKTQSLKKYKKVRIGWLKLKTGLWKVYKYNSKGHWKGYLKKLNTELQGYAKKELSGKVVTGAKSKSDKSKGKGLYIKFSKVKPGPKFVDGRDFLYLTVHFIDGKSKKQLYKVSLKVMADGWGVELSFTQAVFYLSKFIEKEVNGKKHNLMTK
ncbi:MAG TPA: hypothetical protein ENI73_10255 [Spirochaetes bacterium]|nr:hypothetical protein [Spirochaetota bacterium]